MEHTPLIDLPDLAEVAPLPDAEIAAYRESGHVLVRGVASPGEVAAYRPIIAGAALRHTRETRPLEERDTYGKAFLQVGNLWRQDAAVRRFVLARRFGKMAADLMGVDGVRILHDQALFKEPGGGFTPWHQDRKRQVSVHGEQSRLSSGILLLKRGEKDDVVPALRCH